MKLARLVVVVLIGTLTAGCSTATETGQYRKQMTLAGLPVSADLLPANTVNEWEDYIVSNLYTGLTRFAGANGRPSRGVAAKIETADQITWTITLQRGWTFHDGTPVTPESFIRAWNFAADGANAMRQQAAFANIAGYESIAGPEPSPEGLTGLTQTDTNVFTVTLTVPDSQFETRLATAPFAPLPDSFFESASPTGAEQAVDPGGEQDRGQAGEVEPVVMGNGPFIATEINDQRIRLSRYPDYRARKPLLTAVEFVISEERDDVLADIENGVVDAGVVDGSVIGPVTDETRGDTRLPGNSLEYLVFPLWDERFADKDIRQSFSMAIDRDQILAREPDLMRTKATSWTVPSAYGYTPAGCGTACTYNAERARTSLAAGGGFNDPLVISYIRGSGAEVWVDSVCTSISNTLEVACTGNPLTQEELTQAIAAQQVPGPYVSVFPLPTVPDVPASIGPLYLSGAPLNSGRYTNPEFDTLFNIALAAPMADATPTFRKAQQSLGANLPSIPLWYPDVVVVKDDAVATIELTPFHFVDLNRSTVR